MIILYRAYGVKAIALNGKDGGIENLFVELFSVSIYSGVSYCKGSELHLRGALTE